MYQKYVKKHKTKQLLADKEIPDDEITPALKKSGIKRRRTYELVDKELEPYHKKPRMTCTVMSETLEKLNEPEKYQKIIYQDLLWILHVYLNQRNPVMWTGWNSKNISSASAGARQQVWYLQQINQSPTSNTVVIETLRRALKIAAECNLRTIPVTFDLAIAKVAYQIQATESPAFDAVFINLGAFHIEMAYFNAIGKYINESGGPYILIESGVLASGSLHGFIKGKHYNRCKRIHMLLAAALEILRIEELANEETDTLVSIQASRDEINKMNEKPF